MAAADVLAHANADAPLPRRPSPDEVLLAVQTLSAAAHYDHPQPHVRACLVALEQAFTNRASQPSQARGDVSGWSYKLSRLLEALLAARLLKSAAAQLRITCNVDQLDCYCSIEAVGVQYEISKAEGALQVVSSYTCKVH